MNTEDRQLKVNQSQETSTSPPPSSLDVPDLLSTLLRPDKDETFDKPLVSAREGHHAIGRYPVAEAVKQVIGYPRIDNRLATITIKDLLRQNPEPEGGLLRTPDIDAELQPFFTGEAKARDKQLAKIQKEVYQALCPICYTLHFMETSDLYEHTDQVFMASMARKLQNVLVLGFHAAEGIRIERREALAESARWSAALVAACSMTESSAEYDAALFGPEFCQKFHDEARNWKHHRVIVNANSNSSNSNYNNIRNTNNRGRGRGRGGRLFSFSNNSSHYNNRGGTSFRGYSKNQWGNL